MAGRLAASTCWPPLSLPTVKEEVIMIMRRVVTGEEIAQLRNPDAFAVPAWRSPVYRTPLAIVVLVHLIRMIVWLVRFLFRHPVLVLTAVIGVLLWRVIGRLRAETPKSRAGRRTVAFPAELVPEIRWHLERFAEPGERGLVFVGPQGARLRRSNFGRIWVKARAKAGTPGVHFHDLRHTGGTLAAATGASLKELMARLGHSSTRAALIYQHATRDRDQAIAIALGDLARQVRRATDDHAEEPHEKA